MLTLGEELILLALDEDTGAISSCGSKLGYALSGAVIAELELTGHVQLVDGAVTGTGSEPPADKLHAEALDLIRDAGSPKKLKYWVQRLAKQLDLKERLVNSLAGLGIVHREEHTALLIFHYQRYPLDKISAKPRLRDRLLRALVRRPSCDAREAALACLAQTCGLVKQSLTREEWQLAQDQAKRLVKEWPISKAVMDVIRDREAAVVLLAAGSGS